MNVVSALKAFFGYGKTRRKPVSRSTPKFNGGYRFQVRRVESTDENEHLRWAVMDLGHTLCPTPLGAGRHTQGVYRHPVLRVYPSRRQARECADGLNNSMPDVFGGE